MQPQSQSVKLGARHPTNRDGGVEGLGSRDEGVAGNAAGGIRTLKSEVKSLQQRVRRLERTSKTKSATGEAKKRVEVVEDFQTPKKTATAGRATNLDSGTQTPGSGSRRWRR